MNNGNLMEEKIIKREKTDTMLAYILLVLVLGAIAFIVYLKFFKEEPLATPTEKQTEYITLANISDSLNKSTLANKYTSEGAEIASVSNDEGLTINYKKDDTILTINAKLIEKELEFKLEDDNINIVTDIYKEITKIICTYYGNGIDACNNAADDIDENSSDENIRFVNSADGKYVYINTMKSINANNSTATYTEVTSVDITNTNYKLKINNTIMNNINIENTAENLKLTGVISSSASLNSKSIIVTLYDNENNTLAESKKEYTEDIKDDNFEIDFKYDDKVKYELISRYSINVK